MQILDPMPFSFRGVDTALRYVGSLPKEFVEGLGEFLDYQMLLGGIAIYGSEYQGASRSPCGYCVSWAFVFASGCFGWAASSAATSNASVLILNLFG